MEIQVITVTLNSEPPYQRVWMRAEDTARELLVNVIDNDSQPLDMTEYTVEFRARKPDNTEITYTEQVEVRDTAVYIGPIPLAKALETSGIVLCELLLYSTTGYVGTVIWEIDAWMPAVRNEGQQSTSDYQSAVEAAIRAEGAASRAEDAADRAEDFSTHPAEIRNDYWWTWDADAGVMVNSGVSALGIPGLIQEVVAGDNITVDNTDPARPRVSATAGGVDPSLFMDKSTYDSGGPLQVQFKNDTSLETDDKTVSGAINEVRTLINSAVQNTDKQIYVSPSGNDNTGDGSSGGPFATIQHALDTVPKRLRANVTIRLAAGTYNEIVNIAGFVAESGSYSESDLAYGSGPRLTILGGASSTEAASYQVRAFRLSNCTALIDLAGIRCTKAAEITSPIVLVQNCAYVDMRNCLFSTAANSTAGVSVYSTLCSTVRVATSVFTSQGIAMHARYGARIIATANTGSSNTTIYSANWGGTVFVPQAASITGTTTYSYSGGLIVGVSGALIGQ